MKGQKNSQKGLIIKYGGSRKKLVVIWSNWLN